MNSLSLVLYLTLLLDSGIGSLPAPVNVFVESNNFQHFLRWDPGPGTPPGTRYKIIRSVNRKKPKQLPYSMMTKVKLKLPDPFERYDLTVQAFFNQTLSPVSEKYIFTPYEQTKIGSPKVSLAGCGNCIHLNISLPEEVIAVYHMISFIVFWRTQGSKEVMMSNITPSKNYTVTNLQIGTEYCVMVETKINVNRNTLPSDWECIFTSEPVEPSRGPLVLGAVAVLLIFFMGVLMISMFCLHYTGFLCKLKATLPRGLIEALSQGYPLTPERIIPDKISISTEMEKQRKHHNSTNLQPAARGTNSDEEEEEEEEEEWENVYMDRGAELSSGESSCQNSANMLWNSKVAESGGSGNFTVEAEVPDTGFEVEVTHEGLDQDKANAEGAQVSFKPEGPVTDEVEEKKEEEVCESSGNINLFSVTLTALAACEEEEEEDEQNTRDSLTDILKCPYLEPLLPTDSTQTLSHANSQTESDDQTTVALMLPTQEDFTATWYEGRRADTLSGCLKICDGETQHEDTQEEEEEEFSGYI